MIKMVPFLQEKYSALTESKRKTATKTEQEGKLIEPFIFLNVINCPLFCFLPTPACKKDSMFTQGGLGAQIYATVFFNL